MFLIRENGADLLSELPTVPKLHIDELLEQLVSRAGEVVAARDGLRKLLTANSSIVGELSLPEVLRRVVQSACDLTGARYGALGVIGQDGTLEQFIHVGMDPELVDSIGPLPKGKGLLGALIAHPEPITLLELGADPRSSGFPANHPPMSSFLGVPIKLRGEVYGNLYLTENETGQFTAEHTDLAVSLAATAAIAIENARLFRDSQRRQDWLEASTEITRRLLTRPVDNALDDIAEQVKVMAEADVVIVVLPVGDGARLRIEVATGQGAAELTGRVYPDAGTLSQAAIDTGQPIRIARVDKADNLRVHIADVVRIGPVIALPLTGSGRPRGALLAARLAGRTAFSLAELDMAATFAGHAAVALELADARAVGERLALLEDRDRIARDLHDHVIQRLFAAGLTVQSVLSGSLPNRADRLTRVVDDIDETIRQIRTSIFALQTPRSTASARTQLLATLDEIAPTMRAEPHIRFVGPIDTVVAAELFDDVQAVLREALSNAARHSDADLVDVDLRVADGWLTLVVSDTGIGIGEPTRNSGLGNMKARATRRNGHFNTSPGPDGGTVLTWAVPLFAAPTTTGDR
ncbi:Histidine kinase-, DNA gyrase B-, and HSP90-like ATPase [Nakamurella panacisegetis]|uniref:Histidine kinase-, DNA gyrase B-, and HSP90-like ATPase n=1 Tax=Nakamurella panacisegetis TaxID=1090615 RepID=A0A1H0LUB4_9ACTN|nr:GAF domain-containing protein [Nakamurella panacisegetis]SDO71788.1 Histidine kinase-, DNA gyrase B-, and HSP90-like ATPase [Nakamurella panacisegetis]